MIKYFSSLKITDYSKSQSENFLNNLMVLSDKDQINLNLKLKSAVIKSKKILYYDLLMLIKKQEIK